MEQKNGISRDAADGGKSSAGSRLEWTYLAPDLSGASVLLVGGADDEGEVKAIRTRWIDTKIVTGGHVASGGTRSRSEERPFDAVVVGAKTPWTAELLARVRESLKPGGTLIAPFPAGRKGPLGGLESVARGLTVARLRRAASRAGFGDARFYVAIPDRSHPHVICPMTATRLLDRILGERRLDARHFLARLRITLLQRAMRFDLLTPLAISGWMVARWRGG